MESSKGFFRGKQVTFLYQGEEPTLEAECLCHLLLQGEVGRCSDRFTQPGLLYYTPED